MRRAAAVLGVALSAAAWGVVFAALAVVVCEDRGVEATPVVALRAAATGVATWGIVNAWLWSQSSREGGA